MDGRIHNRWPWSPEIQEKKRCTFYGTRAAWIKAGRPHIQKKLKVPSDLPTSYKEARKIGVEYYFTGEPCAKGHVTVRKVNNRHCYECERQRHHVLHQHTVKMPPILEPVAVSRGVPYRTIVL